ncbi:MAG: DUF4190 domain-containing protein [Verrucomicrobiales bacterium]
MKLHCPHCNQLLEATDSMSGQAIKCPACSGDLRVPTLDDSKPTSQGARPAPRPEATTKNSNPERKPEEHPSKTDPAVLQPTPPGRRAPGSVASLVLGILSIVTASIIFPFLLLLEGLSQLSSGPSSAQGGAVFFLFAGLVIGIISLLMSSKAKRAIQSSTDLYHGGGMATAGMVCSIIGIAIFLLLLSTCGELL